MYGKIVYRLNLNEVGKTVLHTNAVIYKFTHLNSSEEIFAIKYSVLVVIMF